MYIINQAFYKCREYASRCPQYRPFTDHYKNRQASFSKWSSIYCDKSWINIIKERPFSPSRRALDIVHVISTYLPDMESCQLWIVCTRKTLGNAFIALFKSAAHYLEEEHFSASFLLCQCATKYLIASFSDRRKDDLTMFTAIALHSVRSYSSTFFSLFI